MVSLMGTIGQCEFRERNTSMWHVVDQLDDGVFRKRKTWICLTSPLVSEDR